MKTLTEFDGFSLTKAITLKKELLAGGKTAEELPQAMGEALKKEGDKLTLFLSALEIAESKPAHLKRVVVMTLAEGEKPPASSVQKEDKVFLAEYFFVPQPKQEKGKRFGKGGKGGKRFGKKGRFGDKNRNPRKDKNGIPVTIQKADGSVVTEGGPEGDKKRRPRRRPPWFKDKKPGAGGTAPGSKTTDSAEAKPEVKQESSGS